MSGAWKQRERDVAEWFGTVRNPLSGRNNVADDGTRRLGDVILNCAVVEVKRRKACSTVTRAKATRYEANKVKKPWAHFEFCTGQPNIVTLTLDIKTMREVSKFLLSRWLETEAK